MGQTVEQGTDRLDASRLRRPALHHVAIKTTDLQAIIDWYEQVVGTRVMFRFEGGAFLTNDAANHRMAVFTGPAFSDDGDREAHTGMHHFAFEYEGADDLLATYARLKDVGITPDACLDHGPTTSFYYFDPDGNGVELQADNFGDWAASGDYIQNDAKFLSDPIGKPVDPDALVAAYRGGDSLQDIHERGYAGEFPPSTPPNLHLPV